MQQDKPASHPSGCWKWPSIALVLVAIIVCVTALKGCGQMREILGSVGGLLQGGVRRDITTTFREELQRITATKGDILEVATVETNETFTRMDFKSIAWNIIYLGTTTSEIRVPAIYRYHIKLSDDWKVTLQDGHCVVIAPTIRPSLPPAIRTERMEKRSEAGWARFNAVENMAELERSITPSLEARAGNASHIERVRDPARKAVAAFVRTWLLDKQAGDVEHVTVYFADESPRTDRVLPAKPTIQKPQL